MKTLAIDCATEACSVALFDGRMLVDGRFAILGRGHAERLVPMIAELPDKGRADRILVSLGPGSFTGVRIGLAAARALGLAWRIAVLGYPTLALVAAMARAERPGQPVSVCMNGGHGEFFVQNFGGDASAQDAARSLAPEAAGEACRHHLVAGNRAAELARLTGGERTTLDLLPDARHCLALGEDHLTRDLAPIYGRGPDAIPPKARA
ncbi:tRNA (adenosine(37)-N6)-threonylcarbamoyltransferase complex dimerization subunit type 1 TsaB [Aurantiacibacter spongiae]|uniref:tRNA (Adenosine(37)-N6)-threonylcarbamoyltransferase complex dimerization subunit type 1 TsaB n=1 Tax=Aurantiacibacter spongiae TaxID=2488860 RepID=A0A3N5DJB8_9SPHN|nr:tRNA (adenosine(37)-N6)-threonylcarbamoyltransferase complex dimerization subunit type 1 TsaB [Aurantiacibacter spongiae]RPF70785.1 tRNA (adenosine(37)-N6)-threonylcarbamoyltransferase complex dimerization subunit type 1 TsaB [Aurantiacibacter spongiae]